MVTQPTGVHVIAGSNPAANFRAAPGGGAKSQQTRSRTAACTSCVGCVTIGPLALLSFPCVPTAFCLLSKNF